jgi:hypothetical protein
MEHWDGTQWSQVSGVFGSFHSVWGRSSKDVWAVGDGIAWHYDGVAWKQSDMGTSYPINSVFGGASDLWAVGAGGMILHK